MNQLSTSLKTNPTALRHIIQYEVLQRKPIFESYTTFCNAVGEHAMNYPDFEFWYRRFYNEEEELERPAEPLTLSELPVEIVGKIVEKLDPTSRFITRHVSKSLRSVVDRLKPNVDNIEYGMFDDDTYLSLDSHKILYENTEEGCLITCNDSITIAKKSDHKKDALPTLAAMLRHPKLNLKELVVFDYANLTAEEITSLFPSNCLVNVNTLIVHTTNPDVRLQILKHMMPGTLETVKFQIDTLPQPEYPAFSLGNILETEQWKQAKAVDVRFCGHLTNAEAWKFHSFPSFRYRTDYIQLADVVNLRNNFQNSIMDCEIRAINKFTFNMDQMADALGATVHTDYPSISYHLIPDSNAILVFELLEETIIRIHRKQFNVNQN